MVVRHGMGWSVPDSCRALSQRFRSRAWPTRYSWLRVHRLAFLAAAFALAAVALLACLLPAARATRIAPASALGNG